MGQSFSLARELGSRTVRDIRFDDWRELGRDVLRRGLPVIDSRIGRSSRLDWDSSSHGHAEAEDQHHHSPHTSNASISRHPDESMFVERGRRTSLGASADDGRTRMTQHYDGFTDVALEHAAHSGSLQTQAPHRSYNGPVNSPARYLDSPYSHGEHGGEALADSAEYDHVGTTRTTPQYNRQHRSVVETSGSYEKSSHFNSEQKWKYEANEQPTPGVCRRSYSDPMPGSGPQSRRRRRQLATSTGQGHGYNTSTSLAAPPRQLPPPQKHGAMEVMIVPVPVIRNTEPRRSSSYYDYPPTTVSSAMQTSDNADNDDADDDPDDPGANVRQATDTPDNQNAASRQTYHSSFDQRGAATRRRQAPLQSTAQPARRRHSRSQQELHGQQAQHSQ